MKLKITVHGVSYEVDVEILDAEGGFPAQTSPLPIVSQPSSSQIAPPPANQKTQSQPVASSPQKPASAPSSAVTSPIAGNVIEVKCKVGDHVQKDQELLVVEAMKMETSIVAPAAGKIKSVDVAIGDAVREGQSLAQFE